MLFNRSFLSRALRPSVVLQQSRRRLNTTSVLRAAVAEPTDNGTKAVAPVLSPEVSQPVKRRVGRPKKILSTETPEELIKSGIIAEPPEPEIPKRRAGRPKKILSTETPEESIKSGIITEPPEPETPKRRAGRPKKIPSTETLEEPKKSISAAAAARAKKRRTIALQNAKDFHVDNLDNNINLKKFFQRAYKARLTPSITRPQDKSRINILSESLCDDVITRLKPSLEKHIGCDIIDMNPGTGLFSSKLHDVLKPRTHILLEPDPSLYKPFWNSLLQAEGSTYKFVPRSGIHWESFSHVLTEEHLPHQVKFPKSDPRLLEPNNTLLFVANIGMSPPRAYTSTSNFSRLFIHQLLQQVQHQVNLQAYGLVRMLIWVMDPEKYIVMPHTVSMRKGLGVDAEIICEKLLEIAGGNSGKTVDGREYKMDMESSTAVIKKMESNGISSPVERRTSVEVEARRFTGEIPMHTKKKFYSEYEELKRAFAAGEFGKYTEGTGESKKKTQSPRYIRMKSLEWRSKRLALIGEAMDELLDEDHAIMQLKEDIRSMASSEAKEAQEELNQRIREFTLRLENRAINDQIVFYHHRDNRKALRQEPPLLHWDRRDFEPLKVQAEEFYPEHELSLLDFHPKPTWPLFRTEMNDDFQYVLSTLFMFPTQSVKRGLTSLAHGAYDWIAPECPTLTDPRKGGCRDLNDLSVKCLNEQMLKEIIDSWLQWPFRPTRHELLIKTGKAIVLEEGEDDWHSYGV